MKLNPGEGWDADKETAGTSGLINSYTDARDGGILYKLRTQISLSSIHYGDARMPRREGKSLDWILHSTDRKAFSSISKKKKFPTLLLQTEIAELVLLAPTPCPQVNFQLSPGK